MLRNADQEELEPDRRSERSQGCLASTRRERDQGGCDRCAGARQSLDLALWEECRREADTTLHAGGITPETIPNVLAQTPAPLSSSTASSPARYRSLDGLAVVSVIAASETPDLAAQNLRRLFDQRPDFANPISQMDAEAIVQVVAELVRVLRSEEKKPLVHHITVRRESAL